MKGTCISAYVTAIANILAENLTDDEIALLAVVLTQLGDTLATISTANDICCNKKSNTEIEVVD